MGNKGDLGNSYSFEESKVYGDSIKSGVTLTHDKGISWHPTNQKSLTVGYGRESTLVCWVFGVWHEVGSLCTAFANFQNESRTVLQYRSVIKNSLSLHPSKTPIKTLLIFNVWTGDPKSALIIIPYMSQIEAKESTVCGGSSLQPPRVPKEPGTDWAEWWGHDNFGRGQCLHSLFYLFFGSTWERACLEISRQNYTNIANYTHDMLGCTLTVLTGSKRHQKHSEVCSNDGNPSSTDNMLSILRDRPLPARAPERPE